MATEQKFEKIFAFEEIKLEEAQMLFTSKDAENLKIANNKICESIARLESSKDKATNDLIDSDVSLDDGKKWSEMQRRRINNFRNEREKYKELMNKLDKEVHKSKNRGSASTNSTANKVEAWATSKATINAKSLGTLTAFFDLAGERSPLPFKTMLI